MLRIKPLRRLHCCALLVLCWGGGAGAPVTCEPKGFGNEYRCRVDNQDLSRVVLYNGGGRVSAAATAELKRMEQSAREPDRHLEQPRRRRLAGGGMTPVAVTRQHAPKNLARHCPIPRMRWTQLLRRRSSGQGSCGLRQWSAARGRQEPAAPRPRKIPEPREHLAGREP